MVINTPDISDEVKKHLNSEYYFNRPILKNNPDFKDCFVCLHPFLIIKEKCSDKIKFEPETWPNKFDTEESCETLSWTEVIKSAKIRDIKSLDRSLEFFHRASRLTERFEYNKLMKFLEKEKEIIPPGVDHIPEIIENKLLKRINSLGYESLYVYSETKEKDKLKNISDLIKDPFALPHCVRIETPDSKILIVEEYDQRFFYIFGDRDFLISLIEPLDLEGFFCNKETTQSWSYEEFPSEDLMDWDEDMSSLQGETIATTKTNSLNSGSKTSILKKLLSLLGIK